MNAIRKLTRRTGGFFEDYLAPYLQPACRIQPSDVIVASFQKSGRTWLRFFIGAYLNELYGLGMSLDWNNFVRLAPGPLCNARSGLLDFPQQIPIRMIFSHDRSTARYFRGRKVVYVTRSFPDILISYYYFHKHRGRPEFARMSIDEFVTSGFDVAGAIRLISHFSRRLESASQRLILQYESLRHDPESAFQQLIDFAGYPFDERAFRVALDHASFESMRSLEVERAPGAPAESLHMRAGGTGAAVTTLGDETLRLLRERLETGLQGELREHYLAPHRARPA